MKKEKLAQMLLQNAPPFLRIQIKETNEHFCLWRHEAISLQSVILHVGIFFSPPQSPTEGKKHLDSIPSVKRWDEWGRCGDPCFQGLPGRLQEVIRGKYVLSSSSSFRPPLDQPASVWENWFSPSPPPLLSCFSSFFSSSQVPFEACSSTLKSSSARGREKRE